MMNHWHAAAQVGAGVTSQQGAAPGTLQGAGIQGTMQGTMQGTLQGTMQRNMQNMQGAITVPAIVTNVNGTQFLTTAGAPGGARFVYGPTAAELAYLQQAQLAQSMQQRVQHAQVMTALDQSIQVQHAQQQVAQQERLRQEEQRLARELQAVQNLNVTPSTREATANVNAKVREVIEIDQDTDEDDKGSKPNANKDEKSATSKSPDGKSEKSPNSSEQKGSPEVSKRSPPEKKRKRPHEESVRSTDDDDEEVITKKLRKSKQGEAMDSLPPRGKPIVVIQNWSPDALLDEIIKSGEDRSAGIRKILKSNDSTGLTPQVASVLAAKLNEYITESLKKDIDAVFYKCAADAKLTAEPKPWPGDNQPKADERKVSTQPTSEKIRQNVHYDNKSEARDDGNANGEKEEYKETISRQKLELNLLREKLKKMGEQQKAISVQFQREREKLREEVARSKNIHARSVQAYVRASVHSLRCLRQSMGADSGDEDDNDKEITEREGQKSQ